MNIKDTKPKSAPVIIAPIILVATKVIARSTTEVKIAPKTPVSKRDKTGHIQPLLVVLWAEADVAKATIRKATATPKVTHKNAGVRVIVAVMRRNAVTIPTIMLATIDSAEQLVLQHDIHYSPPDTIYAK